MLSSTSITIFSFIYSSICSWICLISSSLNYLGTYITCLYVFYNCIRSSSIYLMRVICFSEAITSIFLNSSEITLIYSYFRKICLLNYMLSYYRTLDSTYWDFKSLFSWTLITSFAFSSNYLANSRIYISKYCCCFSIYAFSSSQDLSLIKKSSLSLCSSKNSPLTLLTYSSNS